MQITHCKICGNDLLERLGDAVGRAYAPDRSFSLYRCRRCRLVFLNPQPTPDELSSLYPEDYGPHDPKGIPGNIPGNVPRKALMDSFRAVVFSADRADGNINRGLKSFLARMYNTLAYRSIPNFIKDGVLLDVGSGLGTYLLLLRELGWQVHGIEASRRAARYAQDHLGLDVKSGRFEDAVFPENFFDVITMWHSLEHFPNPRSILLKAHRLLKPGGKLMIGLPNYSSMDRKIFGENWNGLEIPLHLFHFTPFSIQAALECTGFQCRRVIHTIRPSDFAKSLRKHLRDSYGVRDSRLVRYLSFFTSILPAALLGLLQCSSIIVVHSEKVRPALSDQPPTVLPSSGESGRRGPCRKGSAPE